jgi:hypothetical protein
VAVKEKNQEEEKTMAVTGAGFLNVSRARWFAISAHALDRIREHTDLHPTKSLAEVLFNHSRQVKPQEMMFMGYRPGYTRRLKEGQKSWYFRFLLLGEELVAVVAEGAVAGEYTWVTTYHPNEQSEHYRLASYERVAAA